LLRSLHGSLLRETEQQNTNEIDDVAQGELAPIDFAAATGGLDGHHNFELSAINDHCLRIAVFEGEYRWHRHPDSDELFVVVEGCLEIDLDGGVVVLGPGQAYRVPAGARHRTRARERTVNLCFERRKALTDFDD
jgi:mannose-6-phosphate isomerase-like protein (cupin superfamily)